MTRHFFNLSLIILIAGSFCCFFSCKPSPTKIAVAESTPPPPPELRYGFEIDSFHVVDTVVQRNQFFGTLLSDLGLSYPETEKLLVNGKEIFDPKIFREDKPLAILNKDTTTRADFLVYEPNREEYIVFELKDSFQVERVQKPMEIRREDKPLAILNKDTTTRADFLVYEPNREEYIVFELKDSFQVERVQKPMEIRREMASGVIESSLWNAMVNNGLSYDLASKMEDALQWSIDFHHLQKGDRFKLVYDQKYIEGEKANVEKVHAAYYKNYNNEYYAIHFDSTKHAGYYDYEGRPMNKSFLKSPVKYSRISSRYNLRRFHPIYKRIKPHLGTDYAAPHGTPIYSVGDGVVSRQGYTKGNGNFVKVKHNDTYSTQYLHMSRFAKGVSKGVHVKQGQVIGYVGSTGAATGPHVCFRFWKDGKQVNHLNLNFPPPEPMPEEDLQAFLDARDEYLKLMEGIDYQTFEQKDVPTLSVDTTKESVLQADAGTEPMEPEMGEGEK